ncbi:MAG TPA: D-alanine--D-alanine ligase family protein [Conexibacter sp.]|nr:D-alanine--D-alanine ligase family protein [Conexibacter sp.]
MSSVDAAWGPASGGDRGAGPASGGHVATSGTRSATSGTPPRRVVVLGGGRSSEHDVSLASAASVRGGLERAGHEVVAVEISRTGAWTCGGEPVTLTPGGGLLDADAVFPVLHGPFGEDGTVQGLLECLDVPYVGSGVLASAACMDKVVAKELLARAGLPQVDYRAVRHARYAAGPEAVCAELAVLGLPVFVKPARLGSSVGIVRAAEAAALADALESAFAHDPLVIVEAAASGLEIECAVLGDEQPIASEPGEIVLTGGGEGGWYDFAAKYEQGGMELVVPARIPPALVSRVRSLAIDAFAVLGCAGLARADFFVDVEREDVLVNELNTMPGFTETSVYGKLFAASGVPYEELLDRLVELAVERHARERAYQF